MLLWDMRTGKTLALAIAAKIKGESTLVICPPAVIPVWKKAFEDIGFKDYYILSSGKLKEGVDVAVNKWGFKTLIIDEIHMYRNYSHRFKALKRIRAVVDRCWGCTGTPFDKNLDEIFYMWSLLDKNITFGTNRKNFRAKYCSCVNPDSPHPLWEVTKEGVKLIMAHIRPFMSVKTLDTKMVLKEEIILYPVTPRQRGLLDDLRMGKPIDMVEGSNTILSPSHVNDKCLQVLGGFYIDWDRAFEGDPRDGRRQVHRNIETHKWEALRDYVKKIGHDRIIIWVKFIEEYDRVIEALSSDFKPVKFSQKNLALFKQGVVGPIVCHPRSAGTGIDISGAKNAIYVSESPQNVDKLQSKARMSEFKGDGEKEIGYLISSYGQETDGIDYARRSTMKQKEKRVKEFYAHL